MKRSLFKKAKKHTGTMMSLLIFLIAVSALVIGIVLLTRKKKVKTVYDTIKIYSEPNETYQTNIQYSKVDDKVTMQIDPFFGKYLPSTTDATYLYTGAIVPAEYVPLVTLTLPVMVQICPYDKDTNKCTANIQSVSAFFKIFGQDSPQNYQGSTIIAGIQTETFLPANSFFSVEGFTFSYFTQ